MPTSKRGRACEICHSIKIKCELGSSGGDPPCQRCLRLGKDCIISSPIKNKDRVAELEARLEAITRLLNAQNIQPPVGDEDETGGSSGAGFSPGSTTTSKTTVSQNSSKKRRFENVSPSEESLNGVQKEDLADGILEIDHLVSRAEQIVLFDKYRNEIQPRFPLASLSATGDYLLMRQRYPVLLQAITFAAGQGTLSMKAQMRVTKIIMNLVAPDPIPEDKKSLELVQAIQVVTYYYRPPIDHIHVSLPQLIDVSISMAKNLCIDKFILPFSTGASTKHDQIHPADAWRTWSTCYLFSASMGYGMRIPHSLTWSFDDEAKLMSIAYAKNVLPSDTLFCQFVRAERLCEQIAHQAKFFDSIVCLDVNDQPQMRAIQNLITDWKAQIPSSLSSPLLILYEYLATISLHECVLHTPTNKQSFAGPYVAERLSVTDFPTPFPVTQEYVVSLNALRDTSHALMDLYTDFEISTIVALPVLITARALYAQMILIKLYISCTAPGNTYGTFIDVSNLLVELYLEKMARMAEKLEEVDEDGGHTKIMSSVKRMREWVWKYNASKFEREFEAGLGPVNLRCLDGGVGLDGLGMERGMGDEGFLCDFEDLFGEF